MRLPTVLPTATIGRWISLPTLFRARRGVKMAEYPRKLTKLVEFFTIRLSGPYNGSLKLGFLVIKAPATYTRAGVRRKSLSLHLLRKIPKEMRISLDRHCSMGEDISIHRTGLVALKLSTGKYLRNCRSWFLMQRVSVLMKGVFVLPFWTRDMSQKLHCWQTRLLKDASKDGKTLFLTRTYQLTPLATAHSWQRSSFILRRYQKCMLLA